MKFKIKDKDFLNEVMESNRIILEMKLLGNPFFYEPLRTSKDEVLGRSGLQKMLDEDYYRLHLLKKQKPLILDIGSHIGIFPRVIKKLIPNAEIHSVEPDPENFRLLKLNNDILQDTFSYQFGIFANESNQVLKGSNFNSWRSTLNINSSFFREDIIGKDPFTFNDYNVKCVTVEKLVSGYSIGKVDFIGITVPGEIAISILQGAREILIRDTPIISIILYPKEIEQVEKFFASLGFSQFEEPRRSMYTFVKI